MAVNIINSNDDRDKNGLLGKVVLVAQETMSVYQVKLKARFCNCNINVANPTSDTVQITIWLSPGRNPSLIDLFETNILLAPGSVYVRTNIVLNAGEYVLVKSNVTGAVVRVDGYENNLL